MTESDGKLSASILWGGGSVLPVDGVKLVGDQLVVSRLNGRGKDRVTETITATRDGDDLKLSTVKARPDGSTFGKAEFTGKRTPPLPPAPDLAKVKFGEPIGFSTARTSTAGN